MNLYSDISSTKRSELGVTMFCYVKPGGYTEIVATGPFTDAHSIFDHSAFSDRDRKTELRNALRRHARWVKAQANNNQTGR